MRAVGAECNGAVVWNEFQAFAPQFQADAPDDDDDFAPKRTKSQAATASKAEPKAKAPAKARAAPKARASASSASSKSADAAPAEPQAGARAKPASAGASSAGAKKAPAKKDIKEKDAPKVVLEYMNSQNRPYSLINVFDNLHGTVKRAALGRVLDALAASGQLQSKVYGKAKVFWPDQAQYGEITDEMVSALQAKATELASQAQTVSLERRMAEGTLARLKATVSTPDLVKQVEQQEASVAALRERLAACEAAAAEREAGDGGATASSSAASRRPALVRGKDKPELQAMLSKFAKAWKQRKRMVMDLAGQIEEGANMSRKKVLDKAGVETDEEAGGPTLRDIE
jgi:26S proteasome regulatory subunit (ATPase 3-interacting protein)